MLGLADKIAIIERGIDGTSVYLIRTSYLENNVLDLCNNNYSRRPSFLVIGSFISGRLKQKVAPLLLLSLATSLLLFSAHILPP